MRTWITFAAAALALGAAACGSDSSHPSCNFPGQACIDYPGATEQQLQQLQTTACQPNGGTWQSGACASANRIGTCRVVGNSLTQDVRVYTGSGLTAAQAQQLCTAGTLFDSGLAGTWTGG